MKLLGILLLFTSLAHAQIQQMGDSTGSRWNINPQTNTHLFQQQIGFNYSNYFVNPPYYGVGPQPREWGTSNYQGRIYEAPDNLPDWAPVPYKRNWGIEEETTTNLMDTIPSQFNQVERYSTGSGLADYLGGNPRICRPQISSPIPSIPSPLSTAAQPGGRLAEYSNHERVQNMIQTLRDNAALCKFRAGVPNSSYGSKFRRICLNYDGSRRTNKDPGESTNYCYRYMKFGLQEAGIVDSYLAGAHARQAGAPLERAGFENIMGDEPWNITDPRDAPDGAVIVYSGGSSGHIEIKASENEYISDFIGTRPINEYLNRPVIGIYILKEDEL